MTQKFFDPTLTQADIELTTEFMILLGDEKHFNSDNFRKFRLHERFSDPAHEIGAFFAKLVANGGGRNPESEGPPSH